MHTIDFVSRMFCCAIKVMVGFPKSDLSSTWKCSRDSNTLRAAFDVEVYSFGTSKNFKIFSNKISDFIKGLEVILHIDVQCLCV